MSCNLVFDKYEFSLVITTFNHGKNALLLLERILPELPETWEVLVLDNDSIHETDSYQKIADYATKLHNVNYIKHEKNCMISGNYIRAFEMASSPSMMILSDRHFPDIDTVTKHVKRLQRKPGIGIIRGGTESLPSKNNDNPMVKARNNFYNRGGEAFQNFAFVNEDLAGTIYNREGICKLGVVDLLKSKVYKMQNYLHFYLEALSSLAFDVLVTSKAVSYILPEQSTPLEQQANYRQPYSFGARVDQILAFRDTILDALSTINKGTHDNRIFINCYLRICDKYIRQIIDVNGPLYQNHSLELEHLIDAMKNFMIGAIVKLRGIEHCIDKLISAIEDICEIYKKQITVESTAGELQN